MSVRILVGDCRERLRELPDASVHCVVTSPPYFGLRDYGVAEQIGLEDTPDAFVAEMVGVFREVRRVLRGDGVLFLNLGDSYFSGNGARSGGGASPKSTLSGGGGRYRAGSKAEAMFNAGEGGRRAISYGTSGTTPEGSPDRGCLCGSLCDACQRAYRLGKSHSDSQRAPMPEPSPSATSRAHMGSQSDHLPTSDSSRREDRSEDATRDPEPSEAHGFGPPLASPATTTPVSSPLRQEGSRQSGRTSECLSCGCSLPDCAQASARTTACTCDIAGEGSVDRKTGKGASGSAYPHLSTESLKPKDLIGIPWRVAFALQADGWWLRQDIIWHKPNPMPESVTDRCTKAHEYIFLLTKSATYHYDAGAIAEAVAQSTIERLSQPTLADQAGSDRVPGKTNGRMKAVPPRFGGSKYGDNDAEEHRTKSGNEYDLKDGKRNRRSVWTVATQPFSEAHFATFPPALIEPCILAGCPAVGTVLDPFGGAGTTGLVADRLGRNAILIELNPAYATMAQQRLMGDAGMLASVSVEAA